MERITKYSWYENQRAMIQLQSKSEAEFLSKEWRSDLFGRSTARVSIDPKSINVNTAMLRGVAVAWPIAGNEIVTNSSSVIYPFLLTFPVFYKCFDFTLMALHGLCGLMCF